MGIKRIIFWTLLVPFGLNSQGLVPVVQLNGEWYHEYTVSEGFSIFNFSSVYRINLDSLKGYNPSLNMDFPLGTKIKIKAQRSDFNYSVVQGDTKFGISKRFAIPLDSLYIANGLTEASTLKIGDKLIIKKGLVRWNYEDLPSNTSSSSVETAFSSDNFRSFELNDSVISHTVKTGETLGEISKRYLTSSERLVAYNRLKSTKVKPGMVLKVPVTLEVKLPLVKEIPSKTTFSPLDVQPKQLLVQPNAKIGDSFKMAVFLPLGEDSLEFPLQNVAKYAYDFYCGAMIAIDSLSAIGCKGQVQFFDYGSKDESVDRILASDKLSDFDAVIGPLDSKEGLKLSDYCERKQMVYISPLPNLPKEFIQRPNTYQLVTETEKQIAFLATKLAQIAVDKNVVLFQTGIAADSAQERKFIETFKYHGASKNRLIMANSATLKALLNSEVNAVFVCVSTNKKKVLEFNEWARGAKTIPVIFGLREWVDWKEFSSNIKNPSDFYYVSTSCYDLQDLAVKHFHKQYRSRYKIDISKSALLGFDIVFGFGGWMNQCHSGFPYKGLMLSMDFKGYPDSYQSNYGFQLCRFRNFKQEKNAQLDE